jgi:hypothetical protein
MTTPLKRGDETKYLIMFAGVFAWQVYQRYAEGKYKLAFLLAVCDILICAFIVVMFFATGRWRFPWDRCFLRCGMTA